MFDEDDDDNLFIEGIEIHGDIDEMPEEVREAMKQEVVQMAMLRAVQAITCEFDANGEYVATKLHFRRNDAFAARVAEAPDEIKDSLMVHCIDYVKAYLYSPLNVSMQ